MMIKKTSNLRCSAAFLAFGLCLLTNDAHAAMFLVDNSWNPTPVPGSTTGLISYEIRAVATAGETIVGIASPNLSPFSGSQGAHQVWAPITDAPTPTRGSQ